LLHCEHVECETQIRKLRLDDKSDDETVYFRSNGADESENLSSDELSSLDRLKVTLARDTEHAITVTLASRPTKKI